MVHAGVYGESVSYTARSDSNFRFADHPRTGLMCGDPSDQHPSTKFLYGVVCPGLQVPG